MEVQNTIQARFRKRVVLVAGARVSLVLSPTAMLALPELRVKVTLVGQELMALRVVMARAVEAAESLKRVQTAGLANLAMVETAGTVSP